MKSSNAERGKILDSIGFVYSSKEMNDILDLIDPLARESQPLLIHGETGSGKELVALYVHKMSGRKGPFIAENCAALPQNLLESELFGHVKGAFTDAKLNKEGLFHAARDGTLFLDEIGEMDSGIQAKLLKVIEKGHYRKVGATNKNHSNARVLTSTNKGIETVGNEGLREDLWYRFLSVEIPPLKRRRDDIIPISNRYLEQITTSDTDIKTCIISDGVKQILLEHNYPGNIRELQHMLYVAFLNAKRRHDEGCKDIEIDERDVVFDAYSLYRKTANSVKSKGGLPRWMLKSPYVTKALSEASEIIKVLEENNYDFTGTANKLGMTRATLYKWLGTYFGTYDKTELINLFNE